jgi:hypothetical protein
MHEFVFERRKHLARSIKANTLGEIFEGSKKYTDMQMASVFQVSLVERLTGQELRVGKFHKSNEPQKQRVFLENNQISVGLVLIVMHIPRQTRSLNLLQQRASAVQ